MERPDKGAEGENPLPAAGDEVHIDTKDYENLKGGETLDNVEKNTFV